MRMERLRLIYQHKTSCFLDTGPGVWVPTSVSHEVSTAGLSKVTWLVDGREGFVLLWGCCSHSGCRGSCTQVTQPREPRSLSPACIFPFLWEAPSESRLLAWSQISWEEWLGLVTRSGAFPPYCGGGRAGIRSLEFGPRGERDGDRTGGLPAVQWGPARPIGDLGGPGTAAELSPGC